MWTTYFSDASKKLGEKFATGGNVVKVELLDLVVMQYICELLYHSVCTISVNFVYLCSCLSIYLLELENIFSFYWMTINFDKGLYS